MTANPPILKRLQWLLGGLFRSYLLTVLLLGSIAAGWEHWQEGGDLGDTFRTLSAGLFFSGFYLGFVVVVITLPLIFWIALIPHRWLDWEVQTVVALGLGGIAPATLAAGLCDPQHPDQFTIFLLLALGGAIALALALGHVSSKAAHFIPPPPVQAKNPTSDRS